MPKRTDLESIMVIGAGPIVIGQACEFDYSGTQAIKALREDGYRVILVNSNPATIMTDPNLADRTYIEPIEPGTLRRIILKEKPDAILPTVGGQTALNAAVELAKSGFLAEHNVELIGANLEAINKGEDRELFRVAMQKIGLRCPRARVVTTYEEALEALADTGLPSVIRPAFTLGGSGGGIAYNRDEFKEIVEWGLHQSPVTEVLVEESILGWKEYELEVVRDMADNVVIICSIENLDPMGVHTGDSITVAPAQTLTDREYQILRDASLRIIREIGVDTGGSNIQFSINPANGDLVVIEMNPRVSRSSALASKATGFPIAKVAAKLAVGYRLDEVINDITGTTPACFEPSIDYVITKCPRFAFEKFPGSKDALTTQMKSVGEVMSVGRTMRESLQKALRSLEIDTCGFDELYADLDDTDLTATISNPSSKRLWAVAEGFRRGWSAERIHDLCKIDHWFLGHIELIIKTEAEIQAQGPAIFANSDEANHATVRFWKTEGFSDMRLAALARVTEKQVRQYRENANIQATYRLVDTCAGEFAAQTPYLYSSYDPIQEELPSIDKPKVAILGGGPNRIGQGIEFDYCCVHACFALRDYDHAAIMINCNPETVSTDYDTSDVLYFEPLTAEDTIAICKRENVKGVILQFGGQTPLKLAKALQDEGITILGTSPDAIDEAEDRDRFNQLCEKLGVRQPPSGIATSLDEALQATARIGYPVVVRPSYVLGGRAMEIVHSDDELARYMTEAVQASADHPVLIDYYLSGAIELDVDVVCDGTDMYVGGIMQHIEEAGVHSGDSACILPPTDISQDVLDEVIQWSRDLSDALGVVGLMNVQYAVQNGTAYILEVNPRASRTVPFVAKATGAPLARIATQVMLGQKLADMDLPHHMPDHFCVKETIFPFHKFPGVDPRLGPEMRSTGEVMGIANDVPTAFWKAQLGVGNTIPDSGRVLISVATRDKAAIVDSVRTFVELGFEIVATTGTAAFLREQGIDVTSVKKLPEGRPNTVDVIRDGSITLVWNTPDGSAARKDAYGLRQATLEKGIPYFTTVAGGAMAARALARVKQSAPDPVCLQDVHG